MSENKCSHNNSELDVETYVTCRAGEIRSMNCIECTKRSLNEDYIDWNAGASYSLPFNFKKECHHAQKNTLDHKLLNETQDISEIKSDEDAEKAVYNVLRLFADKRKNMFILHSIDYSGKKNGFELDIVVIHATLGLMIFEVKGGSIGVKDAAKNSYNEKLGAVRKQKKKVLAHLASKKEKLLTYPSQENNVELTFNQNNVSCFICLPNVQRSGKPMLDQTTPLPDDCLLMEDMMSIDNFEVWWDKNVNRQKTITDISFDAYTFLLHSFVIPMKQSYFSKQHIGINAVKKEQAKLWDKMKVGESLPHKAAFDNKAVDSLNVATEARSGGKRARKKSERRKHEVKQLETNEILNALNANERCCWIKGGPGTGKTTLLMEKVYRILSATGSVDTCLIVTHSLKVAKFIEEEVRRQINDELQKRLTVLTYNDLIQTLLGGTMHDAKQPHSVEIRGQIYTTTIPFFENYLELLKLNLGGKFDNEKRLEYEKSMLNGAARNRFHLKRKLNAPIRFRENIPIIGLKWKQNRPKRDSFDAAKYIGKLPIIVSYHEHLPPPPPLFSRVKKEDNKSLLLQSLLLANTAPVETFNGQKTYSIERYSSVIDKFIEEDIKILWGIQNIAKFDYVFVDEAEDLTGPWKDILQSLSLKQLVICYDQYQNFGMDRAKNVLQAAGSSLQNDKDVKGYNLTEIFRCTKTIASLLRSHIYNTPQAFFHRGLDPDLALKQMEKFQDLYKVTRELPQGPAEMMYTINVIPENYNAITREARVLSDLHQILSFLQTIPMQSVRKGFADATVVLLLHVNVSLPWIRHQLKSYSAKFGEVIIDTIIEFKGLEADVVVYYNPVDMGLSEFLESNKKTFEDEAFHQSGHWGKSMMRSALPVFGMGKTIEYQAFSRAIWLLIIAVPDKVKEGILLKPSADEIKIVKQLTIRDGVVNKTFTCNTMVV